MTERRAVVVGAGIGGVTAAAALGRRGWRVTLLERAPELGEVGAGISVWPAALEVLKGLGVTERIADAGVDSVQAGLRRPDGKWLVEVDPSVLEVPMLIHRARLHEAITASLGDHVTVRTGVTVIGVTQDVRQATVTTTAGEDFEADLVVAADGIRSAIRTSLHPEYAGPRYSGYTAYRGISAVERPGDGGETWGRGLRFGYVPLVDGRVYWYATANVAERSPAGPDGHFGDVGRLFGDWHDPIPAVLGATKPAAVMRNDLYDLATPLVPFVSGRVVLLGDAAHAMTPNLGQGACAAIQDAGALANLLGQYGEQPAALAAYDAERRRATARLVKRSRLVGAVGQVDNRVARVSRDAVLTVVGQAARLAARRRTAKSRVA